jgi:hypothetical protein
MAYILRRHTMAAEVRLFKRKDAEYAFKVSPHPADASLAPSPDLGGHKVQHRDSEGSKAACYAEIEVRAVRKDGKLWLFRLCRAYQLSELTVNARDVRDNLQQADDRQRGSINDRTYPGFLHSCTGDTEKFQIRPQLL